MVLSMERWKGKVAVVTGASEGIGAAIAQALVDQGLIVVGLARRKEKILEIAVKYPKNLHALKVDITKEQEIIDAFKWIEKNLGPVHVLVNNAGLAMVINSNLTDGSSEAYRKIFDTNVLGLCIATREALKQMEEHKITGHIVHINSVVGHKVVYFPGVSVYPASKFAVTALTETLRQELNAKGSKTKVTSISPGYVKSGFMRASGLETIEGVKEMAAQRGGLEVEDVADAVVYVLSTAPHVQVHELTVEAIYN